MESLDKLRKWANCRFSVQQINLDGMSAALSESSCAYVNNIADEIEQEIAERYIELPVDVDGVPIHIGDTLEGASGSKWDGERFEVGGIELTTYGWEVCDVETCDSIAAGQTRHVKHLTIEDAISDAIRDYATTDMSREEIAAKYAEEIREMMA